MNLVRGYRTHPFFARSKPRALDNDATPGDKTPEQSLQSLLSSHYLSNQDRYWIGPRDVCRAKRLQQSSPSFLPAQPMQSQPTCHRKSPHQHLCFAQPNSQTPRITVIINALAPFSPKRIPLNFIPTERTYPRKKN